MVQLFGIPNIGLLGSGVIAIIFLFIIIWFLMRGKSGRLEEEKVEERETDTLKQDEVVVEQIQRNEKKECNAMKKIFEELIVLAKNVDPDFYIKEHQLTAFSVNTYQLHDNINLSLDKLIAEKMSVEVALETFKLLHASINAFLAALPRGYAEIDRRVTLINEYQNKYYTDLVKELDMDRRKKSILQKLWKNVLNEERGKGLQKAA